MVWFYSLVAISAGVIWIVGSPFGWVATLVLAPFVCTTAALLTAIIIVAITTMKDRRAK